MNPTSRRAAILAALTAAATALTTRQANALPPTPTNAYDDNAVRAITGGLTDAGYVEYTTTPTDDIAATHNLTQLEQRIQYMLDDNLDAIASPPPTPTPPTPPTPTRTTRILCVGDSITLGTGSTDGTGYRRYLTDLLGRRGIAPTYTMQAYGGQTLRYVAPRAIDAIPAANPNIMLVHLGTNDAVQPDLTDWQTRIGNLIDQALAASPTLHICIAKIQYSRNTGAITNEQTINAAITAAVNARTTTGRDTTADMTGIPARWTEDGIHPGNTAYNDMPHRWLDAIEGWLPA